ncbi:hypothetical protein [Candidatus Poriferisodalis sp.]|uniref:hypothetical protein n=1 Tax=Candidatus Poriferisodalis sp. TaxID=3101277 RepID=UPI003B02BF4C
MDRPHRWHQLLDDYLRQRRSLGRADGTVADDKSIVGQWIDYALTHHTDPSAFDDGSIGHFIEVYLGLQGKAPASYRSHIRQWCNWLQSRQQ